MELGDHAAAGVRFVFDQKDVDILEKLKKEHPEYIVDMDIKPVDGHEVIDRFICEPRGETKIMGFKEEK